MLSVIIISKNEEDNIRACLESVRWAEEIIVVDAGSTDKTVEIAKDYTPFVYVYQDWQGYGVQKQRALAHASQEWVLNLDADETVSTRLRVSIEQALQSSQADAYRIPIRLNFYGKVLKFSSSPTRHIRLFRRKIAQYSSDIVHEKILLAMPARILKLKDPIFHRSFRDLSHLLDKMNRYSSYSAKIRIAQHRQSRSMVKTLLKAYWMFFRCYFLQAGFLDGKVGFLLALFNAQSSFFKSLKQIYPDTSLEQLPSILKD